MKRRGNDATAMSVFLALIIAVQGCSIGRFVSSRDNSSPNSANADKKPSDTSASASAICNNAYYPVGTDIVRKYRVVYAKGVLGDREYTESFSDLTSDAFVVNTDFGTVRAHINWKCTTDGLLATQYNNSIDLTRSGASAKVDTVDSNGVTLPPEDRWQPGEKWHAEYNVTETLNASDGRQIGAGEGTVTQDGEIVGSESVTVPAGTFDTMKTEIRSVLNITITMKGVSGPPLTVPVETTAYFAKGTGMIRSVTKTGAGGDATSELLSLNR